MSEQNIIVTGFSPITFVGTVTKHVTERGDGTPLETKNGNPFTIVVLEPSERVGSDFSYLAWENEEKPPVGLFGEFECAVDGRGSLKVKSWTEIEVPDDAMVV